MMFITKEDIANRISELLIENFNEISTYFGEIDLSHFQKTVRLGKVQSGRSGNEPIILHKSNIKSNESIIDVINIIYAATYPSGNLNEPVLGLDDIILTSTVNDNDGGGVNFNFVINTPSGNNIIPISKTFFDSLNQFVGFQKRQVIVDPKRAKQILDTNIYELLPPTTTKQQQINNFFLEYNTLKPPSPRDIGVLTDDDGDDLTETFNEQLALDFSNLYDISGEHELLDNNEKYITWLRDNEDEKNIDKSLEWLYEDLQENYFLQEETKIDIIDDRPEYESKSEGYLKIRNFNQAIIIRNEKSSDIGLIGDDSENPIWQTKGFTITMWVRFLDKVSSGTLFNFGNPFRANSPKGFTLDSYIIDKNNLLPGVAQNHPIFRDSDIARFVRLSVREQSGEWRDSTTGQGFFIKRNPVDTSIPLYDYQNNTTLSLSDSMSLLNATPIPIDFNEWFYIVANYNPFINEDESHSIETVGPNNLTLDKDPEFWLWKIDPHTNEYVQNSGFGGKCKVEIISRTDLLRARGYKTPESPKVK